MSGLYASRDSNSGVVPARDQNHPSPDPGVSIEEPAFLEDLYQRLADVRNQLSLLWAKWCRPHMSLGIRDPYDPTKGSAIEQEVEYQRERTRLEMDEAALVYQIKNFTSVASLAVNDHDVDDIPSEAHKSYAASGGDVAGSKDRT
jgi:hypothetical protein